MITTVSAKKEFPWLLGLVAACWAILGFTALLQPEFSYNKWDNFEQITIEYTQAHESWLHGELPLWNPHQHLGMPVMEAGVAGVFYFPATIALFLVQLFHLYSGTLPLMIAILHLPIAAAGCYLLLRAFEVRRTLAFSTALAACFCGYLSGLTTVWFNMLMIFTWLPWIMLGVATCLAGRWTILSSALIAFPLTLIGWIGHPQFLVYSWLFTLMFAAGIALVARPGWTRIGNVALMYATSALLSLPTLLPMYAGYALSTRRPFPIANFLVDSIHPAAVMGWLLPTYNVPVMGMMDSGSVMGYQGTWFIPAIAGAVALNGARVFQNPTHRLALFALLPASLLFLIFALGEYGWLYKLTYGIPVWSAFQWPFKFFMFSQLGMVLLGGVALETCASAMESQSKRLRFAVLIPIAIALLLLVPLRSTTLVSGWGVLAVVSGVLSALLILGLRQERWQKAFMAAVAIGAVATLGLGQNINMKRYAERYGETGVEALGIDLDHRVIPLSPQNWRAPMMQELGLFESATANGYFSATGVTSGLIPRWYYATLPCIDQGVPENRALLKSHLLRAFNIRYAIAALADQRTLLAAAEGGWQPIKRLESSVVLKNEDALPRAYFATHTYRFDAESLRRGMIMNNADVRSAFVADWEGAEAAPSGEVLSANWGSSINQIDVNAPQGGLLVVSISYYPGWTAAVDGQPAHVEFVNGRLQGVKIPPGAKHVELRYHCETLENGLLGALCGALLFLGAALVCRRTIRAEPVVGS